MRRVNHWNWQRSVLSAAVVAAFAALVAVAPAKAIPCVGDCNGDGEVTVDEITKMVNISLEAQPLTVCPVADANGDGAVTVDEIIAAVNAALLGCTPAPTPTATPSANPVCGDGVVQSGEDCDDGGLCVGGDNAGTACTAESQCHGNGVCISGTGAGKSCASSSDCPNSTCVHCRTFGGDGCAANCTSEQEAPFNLVPGVVVGLDFQAGTSGAVVHGDPLTIPLGLTGSQKLVAGKAKDGIIPYVIPAASVQLPQIPVSTLACACARGVAAKTCGGTLFEADGITFSTQCTPGFNGEDNVCPADKPCAFVHGPGNSATGRVGCSAAGLDGINVDTKQDGGGPDQEKGPVVITFSGTGPSGSAMTLNSSSIGTAVGRCTPSFCTDADPITARGNPNTIPFTTGSACSTVTTANDDPTFQIGPWCKNGSPVSCANLTASPPNISGMAIAGAFTSIDAATIGDEAVVNTFVSQ